MQIKKRICRHGEQFNPALHIERRAKNQPVIKRGHLYWFKSPEKQNQELKDQKRTVLWEGKAPNTEYYLKNLRDHRGFHPIQAIVDKKKSDAERN